MSESSDAAPEWWTEQRNLGAVAHYLAHVRGDDARTIAEVMEKPWNWPEAWIELQSALDFEVDEVHMRRADGRCVISINGQGHLPCPVTVDQVRAAMESDTLALGYSLSGQMLLASERADRVAHGEVDR